MDIGRVLLRRVFKHALKSRFLVRGESFPQGHGYRITTSCHVEAEAFKAAMLEEDDRHRLEVEGRFVLVFPLD